MQNIETEENVSGVILLIGLSNDELAIVGESSDAEG